MSLNSAHYSRGLYWSIQGRRNRGVRPLFVVVAALLALYGYLFPGLFSVGGISKFAQSWLPLALVAMAQAILMLAGGISLAIGAIGTPVGTGSFGLGLNGGHDTTHGPCQRPRPASRASPSSGPHEPCAYG